MKEVLILGVDGMLGNCIFSYLSEKEGFKVFGTSRNDNTLRIGDHLYHLDIDGDYYLEIQKIFENHDFEYVINCLSLHEVVKCIDGLIINSYLPKLLDKLSYIYNYKFIHFSTNGVFLGDKGDYSIADIPKNRSMYGLTKYLGELEGSKNLTIRTSIIGIEKYGKSKNLLSWFLSHKEGSKIHGFSKCYWNGFTTLAISKIIYYIMQSDIHFGGIIHLGGKKISKFHLLKLCNEIFEKKIYILRNTKTISDYTLLPSDEQKHFTHLIPPISEQLRNLKIFYNL